MYAHRAAEERRREMERRARVQAEKDFDVTVVRARFARFIESLLSGL